MGQMRSPGMTLSSISLVLAALCVIAVVANESPFPAADLPTQCNSIERCCMPKPYTGKPGIRQFEFPEIKKYNIRRPAHLFTKKEIERIERGYELMRALPDTDPRSLLNQKNLHCLYCDYALYYPGMEYAFEIHNNWFFLPWHRAYLYWHERILQKLLDDDTFTLGYWAWDNSDDTNNPSNQMPPMFANPNSSLYDIARNNCSQPPFLADLDTVGGCTTKTPDYIRIQNDRLLYTQIVEGAPTPALFYGMPYYFGPYSAGGPGTLEDQPHGTVHAWVGRPDAEVLGPEYHPFDDMGNLGPAANDPIFYAHHSELDRLWKVWTRIPGGKRTHYTHPAFLNTQFTFYDENADLVKVNVSQMLDMEKLGYKYESYPMTFRTNGVKTTPFCNPLSKSAVKSLIAKTPYRNATTTLLPATQQTFKVDRPPKQKVGTEVLEVTGLHLPNITQQIHWKAFLFYPEATFKTGADCPEWAGALNFIPTVGQPKYNPNRKWRVAIGPKLKLLKKDYVKKVVVTFVQLGATQEVLTFEHARILYDLSPEVTDF